MRQAIEQDSTGYLRATTSLAFGNYFLARGRQEPFYKWLSATS